MVNNNNYLDDAVADVAVVAPGGGVGRVLCDHNGFACTSRGL